MRGAAAGGHASYLHPAKGVGDIIEKIIDRRYIGIFKSYRQIIVIEKDIFGHYRKIIVIENLHLISSVKHCSKNKSKRVFHIPNEYEFVLENSAQKFIDNTRRTSCIVKYVHCPFLLHLFV